MNGTCNVTIFLPPPPPLGPWGGAKRSNIIKSQLLSEFQRFFNQTLCVLLQMKDINLSDLILIRPPGSCPRGWTWGYCGGLGSIFFSKIHPELVCELLT